MHVYKYIQYACRKTLADRRVRVRGRFARNTELCQERMIVINNDDPDQHHKEESFCTSDHATEVRIYRIVYTSINIYIVVRTFKLKNN